MEKNIKILICVHKEVPLPEHPYFFPVQGGSDLALSRLPYTQDNTGDHISSKNKNYCELTVHYWFWKNQKCDIVGLNHYRRYFDFLRKHPKYAPERSFDEIHSFLSRPYVFPDMEALLSDCDIVLPSKRHWPYKIATQYSIFHIVNDLNILRDVIRDLTPDYLSTFDHFVYSDNAHSQYNMFITSWKYFDAYSEWLFKILFEVEKRLKISSYVDQARVFGYMSERLINVYVQKNHLKVKYLPVIMPVEKSEIGERLSNFRYTLRCWRNDLVFKYLKL